MNESTDATSTFEPLRGRLFGLAYRMLGTRADAEDIVQEAYVRWHEADRTAIETPEAWLVTAVTRLSIDRLRRLKTERTAYVGPWLPEPLIGPVAAAPDHGVELASDLSLAFLTLLERLAPEERAAFLLHDVFDVDYREIASMLDKSEAACRQVVHRARERVRGNRKRFDVTDDEKARLLQTFTEAVNARNEQALLELFAADAMWTADGGGKTAAAPRPIEGSPAIVRLLLELQHRFVSAGRTIEPLTVNGEPGLGVRENGRVVAAMSVAFDEARRIEAVYSVLNPDKLGR